MSTENENKEKKPAKKGWFSSAVDFINPFESSSNDTIASEEGDEITVSNSGDDELLPELTVGAMDVPTSGDGVFDQKFSDMFNQLVEKNDIEGVDYLEFRQALKTMKGLDDATKYQLAFNTLLIADKKLSKKVILDAVDFYVNVLKTEEKEFNAEMKVNIEEAVNTPRREAEALVSENKDILQQIQNLNEKMTQNQTKQMELNQKAVVSEMNINQTSKNFKVTLGHVIAKLDADKVKISDLVKEAKTA